VRQSMFALLIVLAGTAAAQPTIGIGVGGGDCQSVIRQITKDWFDVRDIMTSDSSLRRPPTSEFRCVSPGYMQGAMPRRAGTIELRCYSSQGAGVCCDANMQSCAML
jgi:hypothetical protein